MTPDSFKGVEIGLFSPGASVSREFAPLAARAGAVVIDNSSAFRMDADIPLVVPEVNPDDVALYKQRGIIANPNCSTIQMVVALKPLSDAAGLERVVVSTYQSVSGKGQKGIQELSQQTADLLNAREVKVSAFPHRIAFNVLPHIDDFTENGYTKEEMKMVNETRKIMHLPDLRLTATTVRVPVFYGHSESVNITTRRKLGAGRSARDPPQSAGHQGARRPPEQHLPDAPPGGRRLVHPRRAHPRRHLAGERAGDVRGRRQRPQGRRAQRRSDRRSAGGQVPDLIWDFDPGCGHRSRLTQLRRLTPGELRGAS